MVDSSSTTAMPVVIILYERGRSGNIFSTGDFKRGGRPGDGELHGGLHGAVHELEQVQGILHLHGIKLLQVGLKHKCFFSERQKKVVFFSQKNPLRWFHDGCCECVGSSCQARPENQFGIDQSR